MNKRKIEKRSKMKPFIKHVNFNHLMPTRYQVDLDVKKLIDEESMKDKTKLDEAKKTFKKMLEARYLNQAAAKSDKTIVGGTYFFKKLRF